MGCSIQEWAPSVVFVGILVLGACCVALKTAHLETNIEKLWVESELLISLPIYIAIVTVIPVTILYISGRRNKLIQTLFPF